MYYPCQWKMSPATGKKAKIWGAYSFSFGKQHVARIGLRLIFSDRRSKKLSYRRNRKILTQLLVFQAPDRTEQTGQAYADS